MTAPNTSLILTEEELKFIDNVYGGRKSAAIHDGLTTIGTKSGPFVIMPSEKALSATAELPDYALDDLELAIHARRLELMVRKLRSLKMPAIFRPYPGTPDRLNYIIVLMPGWTALSDEEKQVIPRNVAADLGECRHLLDFLANLPPTEAYRRWHKTVKPYRNEHHPYARIGADWLAPDDRTSEYRRLGDQLRRLRYGEYAPNNYQTMADLDAEMDYLTEMREHVDDALRPIPFTSMLG